VIVEVSSRQIEEKQFTTALRGYDRHEVDHFMVECAQHTGNLEERTKIAEVRQASSEKELAEMQSRIDVLVQEATDARRRIIEEAEAKANAITEQTSSGDPSRHTSSDQPDEVLRRAEASAATIRTEAEHVLIDARREADSILESATASRASMESQLAEIREILAEARANDARLDLPEGEATSEPVDPELVIDLRNVADEPAASG
jgi:DivIVA domain-containing protein